MGAHNPNYHQTTDTPDTLNMDLCAGTARAAAAALADLADE